jgi:hypothetical protein
MAKRVFEVGRWSSLWFQALEFASGQEARIAAAHAYLRRSEEEAALTKQRLSDPAALAEVAYYVADARYQLAVAQAPANTEPTDGQWAQARQKAAQVGFEKCWGQFEVGYDAAELVYGSSRRCREAELAVAKTKAERVTANAAHRDRMASLRKRIKDAFDARHVDARTLEAADFYLAEARYLLAYAETY